jgi:hypothetical protein
MITRGDKDMGTDVTATATSSIFQKIAFTTGLPLIIVEAGFIILAIFLIIIFVIRVTTALRIRKEIISLNFKVGYIARLLRDELNPPAKIKAPESMETEAEAEKEEPIKEEWKL